MPYDRMAPRTKQVFRLGNLRERRLRRVYDTPPVIVTQRTLVTRLLVASARAPRSAARAVRASLRRERECVGYTDLPSAPQGASMYRRPLMPSGFWLLPATLLLAAFYYASAPASGGFSCDFDPSSGSAVASAPAGQYIVASADAGALRLRPAGGKNRCNGTPLSDLRQLDVTVAPGGHAQLWVDLAALDPTSRIAFDVDLGGNASMVWMHAPGDLILGRHRADIDGDGIAESRVSGAAFTFAWATPDGQHTISGDGGGEVGAPLKGYFEAHAGAGGDTLIGTPGHDLLIGGDGSDMIFGRGGDDVIDGGAGDDLLDGGAGNDQLSGGAGVDRVLGGRGDDHIAVRDGEVDVADGGPGTDTAIADPTDHLKHIEIIDPPSRP
jgi:hypothetical protein